MLDLDPSPSWQVCHLPSKYYVRGDGTLGKIGVASEDDDFSSSQSACDAVEEEEEWRHDLMKEEDLPTFLL